MKKNYFLYIIIVLSFCSCQKELPQTDETPAEVDVYVAGFVVDNPGPSTYEEHPTYWKNGSPVQVDKYAYGARALSITVSGNDVYMAGSYTGYFKPANAYWKNGIINVHGFTTSFHPHTPDELTSLLVSNNDVYMVGLFSLWGSGEKATYYKNEIPIEISDGSAGSVATSIAVSGNDVYVTGVSVNKSIISYGMQNRIAKYWKNGNPVILTDGSKDDVTSSIAVSGTNVYAAGTHYGVQGLSNGIAEYWKNGNLVILTDGLRHALANSIAVSGTDVYVAGTQWDGKLYQNANGSELRRSIAKYWKNGNLVNLTDGTVDAEARSIAVSGNDVYVAGFENGVAKYWKNGTPVILGDISKYSEAHSIFLAKK